MIIDSSQICYEIDKAISLATDGRKGPVWLDLPLDVQNSRINPKKLKRFILKKTKSKNNISNDIDKVISLIDNSARPAVLIGSGVRSSSAINELKLFLENTSIPTTFASSAIDIFNTNNNLSIGSVGSMGCSRAGN